MKLKYYLDRAISIPPHKLALKVMDRTGRRIKFLLRRQNDIRSSTYMQPILSSSGELHRYLQALPINLLHSQAEKISMPIELFLTHQFDLLGSGWVQVKHDIQCRGMEGYRYEMGSNVEIDSEGRWLEGRINLANQKESRHIWGLVGPNYIPIEWHLDFKSGYRWSEMTWYLDIPHGHKPGVDIKIPWELARMQHLSQLAWGYAISRFGHKGLTPSQVYMEEFRNQVLDFIATNPPRFGVNWRCTMEVGIRVSNWLVAYDLFRAYGAEFDHQFKTEFTRSIYQHGHHIINNLEWSNEVRGNHYLSNIVSLLFVAAYLPCTPETDVWLAISIQELIKEVGYQFAHDGTNFEASTCYHRLSAEFVVYATALVLGLPEEKRAALRNYDRRLFKILLKSEPAPILSYALAGSDCPTPFPPWYIERLERMAEFIMHITKPNGHVIQIGDNDSGRFLKLQPIFRQLTVAEAKAHYANSDCFIDSPENAIYWDEDYLDHRHLVAAINGLFQRDDFARFTGEGWLETEIIRQLAKGICLPSYKQQEASTSPRRVQIETKGNECQQPKELDPPGESRPQIIGFQENGNELYGRIRLYTYSDFGLYIYRSEHSYLAIRCGPVGQNGNGGHAHNDNLSFELNIKGRNFIVDGGSYLYTPLQHIRNLFRSTRSHNTLALDGLEQNRWFEGSDGLFSLRNDAQAQVVEASVGSFKGEHRGFGQKHYRQFKWGDCVLKIEDVIESPLSSELNFNLAPGVEVMHIHEKGGQEFSCEIRNGDVKLGISLQGFNRVETREGFFSVGYGKRLKNHLVRCYRSRSHTKVEILFKNSN
jgi:hypothetical protein